MNANQGIIPVVLFVLRERGKCKKACFFVCSGPSAIYVGQQQSFFCFWMQELAYLKTSIIIGDLRKGGLNTVTPGRVGEGNSIVFHLSFLTHSACQYDVT